MGKRDDILNLSVHIQTTHSADEKLLGLIELLVLISSGTKYEYEVSEAIRVYNEKAKWANSSGTIKYQVFDVIEDK